MNRFIFVLGSNWQLSLAELDAVLKNSRFKGKILDYSANIAVVEFEELLKNRYYVNDLMELQYILGGCQKIARIYNFVDIRTIKEAFPLKIEKFKRVGNVRDKITSILENCLLDIFPRIEKENIFFAVSIYPNFFDDKYYSKVLIKHFLPFLNKKIMNILKRKGAAKSLYYKYPKENIQAGNLNPIFPHHVITYGLLNMDRAEIVFGFTEEGVYIARTFTTDDPNFKKKVDEQRPFKEYKSNISPKLTLMMLNFLNLFEQRNRKKIFDPFVGNGTILLFALIEDFQIYGSDADDEKVKNTIQNLNWLYNELKEVPPSFIEERVKTVDITDLSNSFEYDFFDGVCSEPELGPYYKKKPYYTEAKEVLENNIEPLYEDFFKQINKILKSNHRVCVVAPIIDTVDGGDIQLNIENIANKFHFKLIPILDTERIVNKSNIRLQFKGQYVKSLIDAKKDQIIKRKIYIFEKEN
jgi:tRNA G10  N-methylase Trm11